MTSADKADELRRLHLDPALLVMVNVWDAASASVVAALPGCRALATASYSVAAALGYPDGEVLPRSEMIAAVGRIAAAVPVPVSADLEGGYGAIGETVRQAIGVGVVGANIEDQVRPFAEAVSGVAAAVAAAAAEGVAFVLNARTDVFLEAEDRPPSDVLSDAVARGRAFLDAGADCVFVPGVVDSDTIAALVAGIGHQRVSVLAGAGALSAAQLEALGVARVSYGPWTMRVALTALADAGSAVFEGGSLPSFARPVV